MAETNFIHSIIEKDLESKSTEIRFTHVSRRSLTDICISDMPNPYA